MAENASKVGVFNLHPSYCFILWCMLALWLLVLFISKLNSPNILRLWNPSYDCNMLISCLQSLAVSVKYLLRWSNQNRT